MPVLQGDLTSDGATANGPFSWLAVTNTTDGPINGSNRFVRKMEAHCRVMVISYTEVTEQTEAHNG